MRLSLDVGEASPIHEKTYCLLRLEVRTSCDVVRLEGTLLLLELEGLLLLELEGIRLLLELASLR